MTGIHNFHTGEILLQNAFLYDIGDIDCKNITFTNLYEEIEQVVKTIISTHNAKYCLIGGDHSLTYMSTLSLKKANPRSQILIFHFDAHHDCGYGISKAKKQN